MARRVKKRVIVSIDLDGVLTHYEEGWQGGKVIGEPVEGAREALVKLREMGFSLVINSVRERTEVLDLWLKNNFRGVEFDAINAPAWSPPQSSNKIFAHVYIDDRNIENLDDEGDARQYTKESWSWVLNKLTECYTKEGE